MPILDAATIATLQSIRLDGFTQAGLTAGGSSWQVVSTTGDGETEDVSESAGATFTAYAEQRTALRERGAAVGPFADAGWALTCTDATPPTLTAGTVVEGDGLTLRIVGALLDPLYPGGVWAADSITGGL